MDVINSFQDLANDEATLDLGEAAMASDKIEKFPVWAIFHEKIVIIGILHKVIKMDDCGM
jgi:hypothetical protein